MAESTCGVKAGRLFRFYGSLLSDESVCMCKAVVDCGSTLD